MKVTVQDRAITAAKSWNALLREQAFVAGCWVDMPGQTIAVHDPASEMVIGHVPRLSAEHVDASIDAASAALSDWSALLPQQRGEILLRWYELIVSRADDLAALMVAEQGKPLAEARSEIAYGASFIKWFAQEASRIYGEVIPSHLPMRKMVVQNEPIGVVALVTPWNFPSAMLTRKAAAALAAGCTAICVPSTETPYSALALAELAQQAGIPDGVLSVLTGDPKVLVGRLCQSMVVRGLSFTGSTAIGRKLLADCAPTIKRVSLELGGHAPFIVFPDCDVEEAAGAAVRAKYQTSGQDCLAANRIFVHSEILDEFVAAFTRKAAKLVVGTGFDPATDIGPLINEQAVAKCLSQVADAVGKGAQLVLGGERHSLGGRFLSPVVLTNVTADMAIAQEETFGPVAAILSFADDAEVVNAANDTEFGLVAYVFTRDLSRAWRISDALEYGMVAVNTMQITGASIPFGGIKQSGLGREGSRHGIDEYLNRKYVCMSV